MSTDLLDAPALVTAKKLRQAVLDAQHDENRATARKLHAIAAYAMQRFDMHYAGDTGPDGVDLEKSANAEIAACLVDSNPRVTQWLTEFKHMYRFPAVGNAFDAGKVSLAKLTIVRIHSEHATEESLSRCADEILACVHRLAPQPLGVEIERILGDDDSEFASRAHKAAHATRKVRAASAAHGMGRVTTTGTAEEAAEIAATVCGLMDGLCSGDPRTTDEKSVDAHLALVRGVPLLCLCENCLADRAAWAAASADAGTSDDAGTVNEADEPATRPHDAGQAPQALMHIHADVETLLGLAENPAYIEGFGFIDPETARRISKDATWQAFIRAAQDLGGGDTDPYGPHPDDGPGPDDTNPDGAGQDSTHPDDIGPERVEDGTGVGAGGDADGDFMAFMDYIAKKRRVDPARDSRIARRDARLAHRTARKSHVDAAKDRAQRRRPPTAASSTGDSARWTPRATRETFSRGAGTKVHRTPRFPAGFVPPRSPATPTPGAGARIDAWLQFIADYPDDTYAQYPDGHGGYDSPPPGALTYRPSEILKATVRLRDQTCRHPGCSIPAGSCEIDHIVPFDHTEPRRGGWTIDSNLQAECKAHHQLKTAKLWFHEMLPGAIMHTVDPLGTHHITLPGAR